jgi:hypothetical protein
LVDQVELKELDEGGFAKIYVTEDPRLKNWVIRKVSAPTGPQTATYSQKEEIERQAKLIQEFQNLMCPKPVPPESEEGCKRIISSVSCPNGVMLQSPLGISWKHWFVNYQTGQDFTGKDFAREIEVITLHLESKGILLSDFKLDNTIYAGGKVVAIDTDSWFKKDGGKPLPRQLTPDEIHLTITLRHWIPLTCLLGLDFTDDLFNLWLWFLSLTACSNFVAIEAEFQKLERDRYRRSKKPERDRYRRSKKFSLAKHQDCFLILSEKVFQLWQQQGNGLSAEWIKKFRGSQQASIRQDKIRGLYEQLVFKDTQLVSYQGVLEGVRDCFQTLKLSDPSLR